MAGLTAFYSFRLIFMTFNGHARWGHGDAHVSDDHATSAQIETHSEPDDSHSDHGGHGHDHKPHESSWVMLVPLDGAVARCDLRRRPLLQGFHRRLPRSTISWRGAIFVGPNNHVLEGLETAPQWVGIMGPLTAAIVGLSGGLPMSTSCTRAWARASPRTQGLLYTFFYNKWYFRRNVRLHLRSWRQGAGRSLLEGRRSGGDRRALVRTASRMWRRWRGAGSASCRPAISTTTPLSCCWAVAGLA